jgi:hypothetical protein
MTLLEGRKTHNEEDQKSLLKESTLKINIKHQKGTKECKLMCLKVTEEYEYQIWNMEVTYFFQNENEKRELGRRYFCA